MSAKKILSGILMVAGIVLAIPTVGASLGLSALAIGALEVGIALTSSLLLGPSVPKTPGSLADGGRDRLYATLVTTEPRKIWLGHTAGATDVRYQAFTGANQEFYEDIVVQASHECGGQDELWFDNEKAWTAAGGVQGRFAGYLEITARNPGTHDNGIAIDGTWTNRCTLTGCSYLHAKYTLRGPDESTPSPFQGGVTTRITPRGRGALTYDPRRDSTVSGGSGTQRADDQATWVWDDNASRTPPLQLLWFMLGWKINGKLAVGMGTPPARIDLESFITAANICDEPVALAAGGTEPRYRSDGVLSEGDDPTQVVDAICGTMNASLRDDGGRIALQILYNDLALITADFTKADILDEDEEWNQTPPIDSYFNVYRGKYTDPSDNALYQPSDYPEMSVDAPDGIDRIQPFDQPLVESVTQAQRLAKLRLMRNQFQGTYTGTFGKRAWQTRIGKNIRLSHPGLSWVEKIFRVAAQPTISRTGKVALKVVEESASIYDWDPAVDEKGGIVAGTPPVSDPTKNPILSPPSVSVILGQSYYPGLRITAVDALDGTASIKLDGGGTGVDFAIVYMTTPPLKVTVAHRGLTGFDLDTLYYVYADVDSIGDSTPSFGATTVYADAINSDAHPMRMFVGRAIQTPTSGGPNTSAVGTGNNTGFDPADGTHGTAYP